MKYVVFALYVWVVVSVLALIIQLARRWAFQRRRAAANASSHTSGSADTVIDLSDDTMAASSAPVPPAPAAVVSAAKQAGPVLTKEVKPEAVATEARPIVETAMSGIPKLDLSDAAPPETIAPETLAAAAPPTATGGPATGGPAGLTAPAPPVPPHVVEGTPTAAGSTPTPASPVPDPPAAPAPRTLATVLVGVRLPCDLLPTPDALHPPSDDRVTLLTDAAEPPTVGGAIADELERLGFEIAPDGDDEAVAIRGEDTIGMKITSEAFDATVGNGRRFPEATATSVALELWLR